MYSPFLLLFFICAYLTCSVHGRIINSDAKTIDKMHMPKISLEDSLETETSSNASGSSEFYDILKYGGSYTEPLDPPGSNHTNRNLKKDGCGGSAIKIYVIRFNKFRHPFNCISYDPSLPWWQRCKCTWHRYAFENQCYSDCMAARWRNCLLRYSAADHTPFYYRSDRPSPKLHLCCPFTTFFKTNPAAADNPQYKVCRMNVSPWGSNGVQIKKRYTVYFWFCSPSTANVLVPVLLNFRNGVKFRSNPPFPGISGPTYDGWWTEDWGNIDFIAPNRFRDWPGFPFPPPPKINGNDPDIYWLGPSDASNDNDYYNEAGVDYTP